jgi:hypothetical protein
MLVYHITRPVVADVIDLEGFRDNTGTFLTEQEFSGVWVSDVPWDQSGFADSIIFEINVPDSQLTEWEWIEEEANYYREWLVPASMLNAVPRRRVRDV